MSLFNDLIDQPLHWYSAAFAWAPPGVGLAVISMLAGVGMLLIFRMTSDPARIRGAKRLVVAHLLELRVFRDEPAVMWSAQKSLLAANLRYIGFMLRPAMWTVIPIALLLVHLDPYYGWAPLKIGQPAIVTLSLGPQLDSSALAPQLVAPRGITVETPAVRVAAERQVSWRVRPSEPLSGNLRFNVRGETVEKRIEAGSGPRFVPGRRVRSPFAAVWRPGEPTIQAPDVNWIEVQYSRADVQLFGIRMHWLAWFTLISMASALLLKGRFRVAL
jgi:hypothetical protein